MEFNDLFLLHVPDILSAIFLHLSPPDLEAAYVVCAQWRHFIEAHLLSNEITLARLVKSKRIYDWLNSEPLTVDLEYGSDFFDGLDWHNVRGVFADGSEAFVYVVVQDKFHTDVKTHFLAVFETGDTGGGGGGGARLAGRVRLPCAPGQLTFTPRLLLVHLGRHSVLSPQRTNLQKQPAAAGYGENVPTVVFDRADDYAETRLHCPFLWRRFGIGSTADGAISVLGRRKESDTDLVVLTSKDDAGSSFAESSRITPAGEHACSRQAEEHFLAADCKIAVLTCRHGYVEVFNITGPLAQSFFKYSNAHFDVLVEPRCVTESFTPVVLRAKPGEPASHGLVRVFDHETGLVLYDEEVHDDSAFRIGVSDEYFVAAHNFDGFIDICHLGSEFALRRLDLPADWTVNSVQVLEDRLLLLTRCIDEAKTSTSWGEVNVCDLEAQEIFLTFPSRKVLFEARITGSRHNFDSLRALDCGAKFVYQEHASEKVKLAFFEKFALPRK